MKQKAKLNPKVDVKGASSKAFLFLCKDAQITFITLLTIIEDRMTYKSSLSQSWDKTKNGRLNSEIRSLFPVVPEGLGAARTQYILRVFLGEQEQVKRKVQIVSISKLPFQPHEWDLLTSHTFIYPLSLNVYLWSSY